MSESMTVEQALTELREMFPRKRTISIVYKDADNLTGVWIHLGGVCCGFGPTLNSAMAQVREWKASHQP